MHAASRACRRDGEENGGMKEEKQGKVMIQMQANYVLSRQY